MGVAGNSNNNHAYKRDLRRRKKIVKTDENKINFHEFESVSHLLNHSAC